MAECAAAAAGWLGCDAVVQSALCSALPCRRAHAAAVLLPAVLAWPAGVYLIAFRCSSYRQVGKGLCAAVGHWLCLLHSLGCHVQVGRLSIPPHAASRVADTCLLLRLLPLVSALLQARLAQAACAVRCCWRQLRQQWIAAAASALERGGARTAQVAAPHAGSRKQVSPCVVALSPAKLQRCTAVACAVVLGVAYSSSAYCAGGPTRLQNVNVAACVMLCRMAASISPWCGSRRMRTSTASGSGGGTARSAAWVKAAAGRASLQRLQAAERVQRTAKKQRKGLMRTACGGFLGFRV